ncbi:MAG: hypothetical protein K2J82_12855 [Muribaculaceae bacterium]|nr:hypothetical protein [Muribaculaceae bacterium]MDE6755481.1 hypothetical protein [Muribaculaceae bacterium]
MKRNKNTQISTCMWKSVAKLRKKRELYKQSAGAERSQTDWSVCQGKPED